MKILLIGATGTLGAALHKTLDTRGHEVLTLQSIPAASAHAEGER